MTEKINLLFVIDGLYGGGKERQLVEIIRFLPKTQFIIGVITFNKKKHYTEIVKNRVDYFKELRKRSTRLEPLFTIWKSFFQFKPDIVHTWDSLSSFYAYFPSRVIKARLIDGSIRDSGIDKGWQFFLKRFFLIRADKIISNSFAGLKHYGVNGEVLYNAIDITRFKKSEDNSSFNIIMVANFSDYKDHNTFIKASSRLLQEKIVDEVFLCGDGPNKEKYINVIKITYPDLTSKFIFLGLVKNVEEYLAKCKVGLLCSTQNYSEGISNSILEYMAAGLIAIATNTGGMPEIIEDGINGFLMEEGDSEKILQIIKMIKNDSDKFNNIVKNAQKTISEKFNIEKNMTKLINIYKELCCLN